ncbi:Hypothetical protein A7982_09235 [Minicystis rosea]|nr:Hypothetical protein A7982_09235 [Minicystis rosea]
MELSTNTSMLLKGSIDGLYRGQYTCDALIENQLVRRGDSTKLRTETSGITVYQAEVQVLTTDPVNPQALAQYTVPVSGFADPGSGTEPGVGAASIMLIDNTTLKKLAAKAQATNQAQSVVGSAILHGRTLGGIELTSNELRFPIDVFAGSTCAVPSGDPCVGDSMATANCRAGQDGPTDCRLLDPCAFLSHCSVIGGVVDLSTATCPGSGAGDGSCCP